MGKNRHQRVIPAALLTAMLPGLLITVLAAVITASLISAEILDHGAANIGAMLALLMGSFTAAAFAGGKTEKMRLILCMSGALAYLLIILSLGATVFDGVKSDVGVSALLITGGGITAFLLGAKGKKRHKYKLPKF